ncbi:MAG: sulfotransferase [Thermoleophilia bacterium]|nr:sulfotransferase [Thermoleophilia bacterium]
MTGPPLFVLGVRRSGTTLLRVMLDRNSELAVPDESYFIPQLVHRHPRRVDPVSFLADVRRLPTLVEWNLLADAVEERLRPGMTPGEAIGAVFAAYAGLRGKSRWGDKTPLYMQYLPLLERTFPDARFVHLVRDGRDAAVSFLSVPRGIMTEGWGHPTDAAGFARLWRTEVSAARALGRRVGVGRYLEVMYDDLVGEPTEALRRVCAFSGLEYQSDMLDFVGRSDSARKPHQQRLNQRLTPGVRDWRTEMTPADVASFEAVAGGLLAKLGYESGFAGDPSRGERLRLAAYRAQTAAWHGVGYAMQRSPLWRRRHPCVA